MANNEGRAADFSSTPLSLKIIKVYPASIAAFVSAHILSKLKMNPSGLSAQIE